MKNLLRLLALFKPYLGWMLLGYVLTLITLFSNVLLMAVSGWFIASMALAGLAGVSMNYFSPGAIIRGAAIFRTSGRYAERLVTHEATFRLLAHLRVWFYQKIEPLAPAVLEQYRSGDLLSRIRSDIDALDNFYIRVLLPLLAAISGVLLFVFVMSRYDAALAAVLLFFLLLAGLALPLLMLRLGQKPAERITRQRSELQIASIDAVQGLAELSVLGALAQSRQQLEQRSEALIAAQRSMSRVSGLAQSGLLLFSHLAVIVVMIVAIPLLSGQQIEAAELAMLALFTLAAFEAVMPLPEAFRLLSLSITSASRLFELADRSPTVENPPQPAAQPKTFSLQVQDLAFRYSDQHDWVLQGLDLSLPFGKKLALVGETGIGKSSLIPVLLRQREFQAGSITLGGISLRQYSDESLRRWISVASQQAHLFNTTIRNNITLGKPDASDSEIEEVLRIAQLLDFVEAQPDGLETWVGETGVKLSGGQARRISIARAMLRDFRLLILDEPGEGLDTVTEKQLMHSVIEALNGRSLLLITHSHQALEQMDEVITLESLADARKAVVASTGKAGLTEN